MIEFIEVAFISAFPFFELRGGIPLGIALGLNPFLVFIIAVASNFLIVPLIFIFLDKVHIKLLRYKYYEFLFNKYIGHVRRKFEKNIVRKTEFLALMFVVAIPLPGTGAWTASILSWLFHLKRLKTYIAIFFGVVIAGIVVTLASLGVISLF